MIGAVEVRMWGTRVGAVTMHGSGAYAVFQYDREFANSGIEVSPLVMPLRVEPYAFPQLAAMTFHGLPGLLADSLPDKFGTALIDAWLESRGEQSSAHNVLDRLSYIGRRGMGALEFVPAKGPRTSAHAVRIDELTALATQVLTERAAFVASLSGKSVRSSTRDMLRIGTSAGGARAKAVIAWNRNTDEVRSGQVDAGPGFEYWLLKFDGVSGNRDRELSDPEGFCAIEFAYSLMAARAGVTMSECRMFEEGGRRHFMTRRFDRLADDGKLHMQSLGAIAHYDLNMARTNSYEQALGAASRLGLSMDEREQMFRRMVFNVVARNQDDHVKNIAFLMNKAGRWSLTPAFDVTYAFNPQGAWTGQHQMSINGKFDTFTLADLKACAATASLRRTLADDVLHEVSDAVGAWREFAAKAGVDEIHMEQIEAAHRLAMPVR